MRREFSEREREALAILAGWTRNGDRALRLSDAEGVLSALPGYTEAIGPFYATGLVATGTAIADSGFMSGATFVRANTAPKMGRAGRVVGVRMVSNEACTTGNLTAKLRINGVSTPFNTDGVQINAAAGNTLADSDIVDLLAGPAFAAGDLLGMEVVTSSFAPTTADVTLWATVVYDPF